MDPIAFAWGPDGKLWVVEMGDYPRGVDGKGKHGGVVRALEDADGDGRYDKSTVFLDDLGFPTGVMPWRNGVLVTCAPGHPLCRGHRRRRQGRQARSALSPASSQGNQQHRVNGLGWGLDNWIYGANGDARGGKIELHKTRRDVPTPAAAIFASGPTTGCSSRSPGRSQFGRNRDDWGNWFGCDNSDPMWHFVLADHYLRRNPHVPAADGTRRRARAGRRGRGLSAQPHDRPLQRPVRRQPLHLGLQRDRLSRRPVRPGVRGQRVRQRAGAQPGASRGACGPKG